jgi:hypothetical protein
LDLAHHPSAKMLDGTSKEHFLEQRRHAELARIHDKSMESTLEQRIEIDDELTESIATSSSSATPTSTSTSTSSVNRRKTRWQTRPQSLVYHPVTMPPSLEENEPVAHVQRSGRRAKKSQPTGRAARLDGPAGAGGE